ncbi:MAG: glycosyltransferase family 4 protein [Bryobacteraceae bacterium]
MDCRPGRLSRGPGTARQRPRSFLPFAFSAQSPETAKQELLARSRALLLPSRGEGFGLAYLEAMRLGRPSLTSTLDAGREVVNPPECGLAADPADLEALANAVIRLLGDTAQWPAWSASCRRRYEERFTETHFNSGWRQPSGISHESAARNSVDQPSAGRTH